MTAISKHEHIDQLPEMVAKGKKYNNTFHATIKIKPVNVKGNIYIDFPLNLI